jgi:hypothetical protein
VANVYFNDTITKDNPIACCLAWNKYCYKTHLCRVAVFRKSAGDSARTRSVHLLLVAADADCFVVDTSSRVDSRLKTKWIKLPLVLESL